MSGRPAYERSSYRADIKALRSRGHSMQEIADRLGLARSTVYRILRASR